MAGWCGWTADRRQESEQVVRLILMAVAILTNGCHASTGTEQVRSMDGFTCERGKEGWRRAVAVTPDVVPPCMTGSVGKCDRGFEYVSGTGWCRPEE